ncbi:50S ribosomal protein L23 [Leptolyngbya sp. PCC 6406]|uniref:50S ribosomal protein L23 n=1 Tax=Leptolyngbya sp. PCC 6406 TaxID=1173264 RepID=UPI0002AD0E51|nr:50S ribosomal protein L23 [Leptolyngbya sp. PCC 6406]
MVTNTTDIAKLADIIRRPIVTEKATLMLENNQYVFEVTAKARKPEIKAAIEGLFEVKVTGISTMNQPRKRRRIGRSEGYRSTYKRAVVTLAQGDSIPLFPDL